MSNKLTFYELIEGYKIEIPIYKIEIPIIQRDYAQGREGKKDIREGFLTALLEAVVNDKQLELDFVYGSVKNDIFQPLDGQQRLTTLFLLYWYIATKENKLDKKVKELLTKFTYETRTSSREFCNNLINQAIVWNYDQKPSELIIDSAWFFLSWGKDPTIKSMLTMLDAIHKKFCDQTGVWDKLSNIRFHFIEWKDFGLSDDLYIKMNARGKPLTDFENFKAKFEQHITKNEWEKDIALTETFSHKIDTDWTDLFWGYRDENNQIDKFFLKFIAGIVMISFAKFDKEIKELSIIIQELFNSPSSLNRHLKDFKKDIYCFLVDSLNVYSKNCKDEIKPDLKLWDYIGDIGEKSEKPPSLFNEFIKEHPTYQKYALFYAQTCYLLKYETLNKKNFSDWMRVIRNIVFNSSLDSANDFVTAIRFITKLSSGLFKDKNEDTNIYDYLSKNDVEGGFSKEQFSEECKKAKLLVNDSAVEKIFKAAEDMNFCKGKISVLLECSNDHQEEKFDISKFERVMCCIEKIFPNDDISSEFRATMFIIEGNDFYKYKPLGWWGLGYWIQKYRLILDVGELKKDFLKSKDKYFFTLINQLIEFPDLDNPLSKIRGKFCESKKFKELPKWKQGIIENPSVLNGYKFVSHNDEESVVYLLPSVRAKKDKCKDVLQGTEY